jgi:organic hydroperoxide reductase OsmC/OhrA
MTIRAQVQNEEGRHRVTLSTNGAEHALTIPPRPSGFGSRANGGELLFLALATCYCNDVYREAAALGVDVRAVEVEVEGEFGGVGEPAAGVSYRARVTVAGATEEAARHLLERTDRVAEVQNTLRAGVPVRLGATEVEIVP